MCRSPWMCVTCSSPHSTMMCPSYRVANQVQNINMDTEPAMDSQGNFTGTGGVGLQSLSPSVFLGCTHPWSPLDEAAVADMWQVIVHRLSSWARVCVKMGFASCRAHDPSLSSLCLLPC